jgi:hypothetical protein
MKHLFLSSGLAQLAKKKQFNEPCFGYYDLAKDKMVVTYLRKGALHLNSEWSTVSAPLYQQIIYWLFDKGFYLDDQWVVPEGFWICDLRDIHPVRTTGPSG